MAIVLSLVAAACYGLSDFVGGVASRRISPWTIAFVSQVGGAACVLVLGLVLGGSPTTSDWSWAVVAGLGNGVGTSFLYRGLSSGRMGVVGPVSAVGAALVPVAVAVATGEGPSSLVWLGILSALPAIWLVAREPTPLDTPTATTATGRTAAGLLDGVLAGVGFGTLFAALGQVPDSAGLVPLALNQVVGAVVVVVVATGVRAAWVPRRRVALLGLVCGLLGGSATALFLLATHEGSLAAVAVITSLYPAFTVVLAATVLREPVHRAQAVGLVLCAAAVALVAAG